jgi:hypothetical protein
MATESVAIVQAPVWEEEGVGVIVAATVAR